MVSAVKRVADVDDSALPTKHSTGRVWEEIDPADANGLASFAVDRSLVINSKLILDWIACI